jgi:Putative Ig domain
MNLLHCITRYILRKYCNQVARLCFLPVLILAMGAQPLSVSGANFAPVFGVVHDQTVNVLIQLSVTDAASEADTHATLSYTLLSPPTGMAISPAGVVKWTPTRLQSPSTNLISVVATSTDPSDALNPSLAATNTFTVTVIEVNQAPVLASPGLKDVYETTTLLVTNPATTPNIHAVLSYALVAGPTNATVDANGVFSWTPTREQGLTTNRFAVAAASFDPFDAVNPSLSATNSFQVVVWGLNPAPTTPAVPDQVVDELTTLVVTNLASTPDARAVLSYALSRTPTGMGIDGNGVISWTPAQTQSPSTNTITVITTSTDAMAHNAVKAYATNSFRVVVLEVNQPPVLPVVPTITVPELHAMAATNTAAEANIHSVVSYALANAPAGAVVDARGVVRWTPQQSQSPGTNVITVVAAATNMFDSSNPVLFATNSFTVVVQEVNLPPVIAPIPPQTVNEFATLVFTNAAVAQNIHASLSYSILSGPSGAAVDDNGVVAWTPTQDQSPSTNRIIVVVASADPYDAVNPVLTATNSVLVVVREVNQTPVLPVIPAQFVDESTLLTVTNAAVEPNVHAVLSYALVKPPVGAAIDANGVITWIPSPSQSPATNAITTVVTATDPLVAGGQRLYATNMFQVIVREVNQPPQIQPVLTQTVNELQPLAVTNFAAPQNVHAVLSYSLLAGPAGATVDAKGVLRWTPGQAQSPSTNQVVLVVSSTDPLDAVNPVLTATNSYSIVVVEVNRAPVFGGVQQRSVNELSAIVVTNSAVSPNIHSIVSYALLNPPDGAAINANGVFTWTPTQIQSPGTNVITTVATATNPYDLVNPQLAATNTFTVVVWEINQPPTLPVIPTQYVNELTFLTVTNAASDPDIHAILTYVLARGPAGMDIDPNGIITWEPSQVQSPGTNVVTTVVTSTDNLGRDNPIYSATNSFVVIVREINKAPIVSPVPAQTVAELSLLSVTNSATAPNIHASLNYALVNPPAGAAIDFRGVVTWTPSQNQSPSTNTFVAVATSIDNFDAVNPLVAITNSFQVVVLEVNQPPELPVIDDQSVNELEPLVVTNTASDSNIHTVLSYALVDPPAGAAIDTNGVVRWTPSQAQSPGTNVLTTVVAATNPYDASNPVYYATNSFNVVVNEVNQPPVLSPVATQSVTELTTLTVSDAGILPNLHASISYALLAAPQGAVLGTNGVFQWVPSQVQSPSTNLVAVAAFSNDPLDPVNPVLAATNSFQVVVVEANKAPVFAGVADQQVDELAALSVTNAAVSANVHAVVSYALLHPPAGASIDTNGVFTWTPSQTQSPGTNLIQTVAAAKDPFDGANPVLYATNSFQVVVREVNFTPVLPAVQDQSIQALHNLEITNTPTFVNIHSTVTWSLAGAPAGAVIDTNGVVHWTPTVTESPSTNLVTVIAASTSLLDAVHPLTTATNTFTVIVFDDNLPPETPVVGSKVVPALSQLRFSAGAIPSNPHASLSYSLAGAPDGASIDASGGFTWTPSQVESPGLFIIDVVVTSTDPFDLLNPVVHATNSITVNVLGVSFAPVLPSVAPQFVTVYNLLAVTNAAVSTDIHAVLNYALVNPPARASIDPNGVFRWRPAWSQGPSTNVITTVVTSIDNNDLVNPILTATNRFTVVVVDANQPPVFAGIGDQSVAALTTLVATNAAADIDPNATVSYAFDSAPPGMTINPASGVIEWTPSADQAGTNVVVVTVATSTDVYDPVNTLLTATNAFSVTVGPPLVALTISETSMGEPLVAWPRVASGYLLQHSPVLDPAIWTNVTARIQTQGASNFISLPVGERSGFFRLDTR